MIAQKIALSMLSNLVHKHYSQKQAVVVDSKDCGKNKCLSICIFIDICINRYAFIFF